MVILGLSEVRRKREYSITLQLGNLLFFWEGDHLSQDGVGFQVNKSLGNNGIKIVIVSPKVA